MFRKKLPRVPSYRLYKRTGQAVVTLNGKDFYLGTYGTEASRREYDRLVGEWQANGRRLIPRSQDPEGEELTVNELVHAYWKFAETYYVKEGQMTDEQFGLKAAFRPLTRLYGGTPVAAFGPLRLKTVRQLMIESRHSRRYINDNTGRIKRLFKWGVENELVPPDVYQGLAAVAGLRRGRSEARETPPIRPVPDARVQAIKTHVSRQVWAMIEMQRLTGMRSGELVNIRSCDIEMSGDLWEYRPEGHKTEHHGIERIIPLGPRSQKVIRPFLKPDLLSPLFSPADAESERRAAMHASRNTPLSYGNRPGSNRRRNPKRKPRDRYSVDSYRRAIQRACDKAFPPPEGLSKEELKKWRKKHHWHPHQLRHNVGTGIRKEMGLEAAQVFLGHKTADVTEIYAERNLELARQIAARFG